MVIAVGILYIAVEFRFITFSFKVPSSLSRQPALLVGFGNFLVMGILLCSPFLSFFSIKDFLQSRLISSFCFYYVAYSITVSSPFARRPAFFVTTTSLEIAFFSLPISLMPRPPFVFEAFPLCFNGVPRSRSSPYLTHRMPVPPDDPISAPF